MPEHHLDTPTPVALSIELGRGEVRVGAVDTSTTSIDVRGDHADDVRVEHDGDEIRVIGPRRGITGFGSEPRLEVVVSLPTGSHVGARLGSADLTITGTITSGRIKTGSGDVTVATTTGDLAVATGSGDIDVHDTGGALEIQSGSGDVVVGTAGSGCAVSTGSGDISVGEAHDVLAVKTGSGDVTVDVAHDGLTMATGSGDLQVRRADRGRITTRGASGEVSIAVAAGVPVWTDITTVSGRIHSTLPVAGEPQPGQDHLEIRASTASGDVLLTQA